jgi:signal transduction histidine kinase
MSSPCGGVVPEDPALRHPLAGGILAALGLGSLAVVVWHLSHQPEPLLGIVLGIVPPAVLSVAIVAVAVRLAVSEVAAESAARVVAWTAVGGLVAGGSAIMFVLYQSVHGVPVADAQFAMVAAGNGGMAAGVFVAWYDCRARHRRDVLAGQRQRLEALNQLLRHDIRNDMTVIMAHGERLRDGDGDEASLDLLLEKVEHVVELTETARNLTETMRTDEVDLQPVGLDRVLGNVLEDVRTTYPDATVEVDGEVPSVPVRADDMLPSVFKNLLNNAVQHHDREEPHVEVGVDVENGTVAVTVADDGPGIPDAMKERVFEHGEAGPGSGGSGLGLYLVRTLVDQYGGEVTVADNEPRGTVFTVRLERA